MDDNACTAVLSHEVSRRTLLKAASLGLPAGMLAAGRARPAAAQDATKTTVVLPEEPPDLDPFYYALSHIPVTRNIYDALVDREPEGPNLIPSLALEWTQTSDTAWQFKLRDGVTFHNGTPFNAEAAAFAINYVLNNETQATGNFLAGTVATAVDNLTLDVTTPTPDPILPYRVFLIGMPEPASFQADPVAAMRAPIGTGPYKLVNYAGGDRITVEAYDGYWGEAPTVKSADFVYRTESSVRVSMIQAGEADIARDIAPQDAPETRAVAVTIPETPFMRLDVPSPPLNDIRIRQAIDCAVNREELAQTVFGGYAEPAGQIVTEFVVGYNPALTPTPYDPQKAKDLVAAAKADGVPVDLELEIFGRNGIYPNAAEAMEILQAWLQEIGLTVKVTMMDVQPWIDVILQQPIPEDRRGLLQSSAGVETGDASFPVGGYFTSTGPQSPLRDPKIDEMHAAASMLTGEERNKAYQEILKYVNETHVPFIYLVHIQAIYALSERTTWTPRSDNMIRLQHVTISG
jgi:peptide/nickel transport system substrate-binding protein